MLKRFVSASIPYTFGRFVGICCHHQGSIKFSFLVASEAFSFLLTQFFLISLYTAPFYPESFASFLSLLFFPFFYPWVILEFHLCSWQRRYHAICGGCRGSPKTVKPPKYFRKTVKPSQNSAKTVFTFFHALHVPPRFCAVDECLVIIYMTSNHL